MSLNAASPRARANVLGVGVHAVDMSAALAAIDHAITARRKGYVCLTGVHGVMEAQGDPELRRTLNGAFLNLPDGMPTVWVGRLQGYRAMDRVFGPDLMLEVCRYGVARGWRHYLYGGDVGVAPELAANLERRFPGLRMVGTHTPPFRPLRPEERSALAAEVRARRPDVLWVGLSTPKQERFMRDSLGELDATLMFGVGAAFDYHTGRIQDAPRWMKRSGLQWAHRLAQDPRRLWRRYATNNPRFVMGMGMQLSGLRPHSIDDAEGRGV